MPDNNRTSRQLIDSIRTVKTDSAATPVPAQPPDQPSGQAPAAVTASSGSDAGSGPSTNTAQTTRQPARPDLSTTPGKTPMTTKTARASGRTITPTHRSAPQLGTTKPGYQSRRRVWPD